MEYRLPSSAREYVLFQRTTLLPRRPKPNLAQKFLKRLGLYDGSYQKFVRAHARKEAERIDDSYFDDLDSTLKVIQPHIPDKTKTVLDIGCGIAGLDLLLYQRLTSPSLYLLDKTSVENTIWYMFSDKSAFYNSLEVAKETLMINGVPERKISLIDAPESGVIDIASGSIDLIVSTISWGFHYPVKTYLESAEKLLSQEGVLILDIRKNTGGEEELNRVFHTEVIFEGKKLLTIKAARR
jgi:SAM-dependent methyltransferase